MSLNGLCHKRAQHRARSIGAGQMSCSIAEDALHRGASACGSEVLRIWAPWGGGGGCPRSIISAKHEQCQSTGEGKVWQQGNTPDG